MLDPVEAPASFAKPEGRWEVFVVLGCYRGGTSVLARALPVIGVPLPGAMLPAGGANPTGYWENREILDLNLKLSKLVGAYELSPNLNAAGIMAHREYPQILGEGQALLERLFRDSATVGFKHPGTSRMLFYWQEVFRRTQARSHYLISVRAPVVTVESLRANFHLRIELGLLLWLEHLIRAVEYTKGLPRVLVNYEDLIRDPRPQVFRIAEALGWQGQIDPVRMDAYANGFVDKKFQHATADGRPRSRAVCRVPLVEECYGMSRARAADQLSESDFIHGFSALARRFQKSIPEIFADLPWLADESKNRISRAALLWYRIRHEGFRSTTRRLFEHVKAR